MQYIKEMTMNVKNRLALQQGYVGVGKPYPVSLPLITRNSICNNEDGYLHIHTQQMYGQRVKVCVVERDRTGEDAPVISREVLITDNKACVVFPMQELLPKLYSLRCAWLEGDNFDLVAIVKPVNENIPEKESVSPLYLEIDKRSYTPAKSTLAGTRKFVIGSAGDEEKEVKQEDEKCFCGKKHVDLRSKVAYQTQFDPKFGNDKEQRVACFNACKTILINAGLSSSSAPNDATVIKVTFEVADPIDKANQVSYLSINAEAAQRGIMYIDEQLESDFPILVGVDHTQGNKYNEGTTDHFVVIVGRGCDDNKAWYLFYEVGTAQIENGLYKGEMDGNKLYLDSDNKLYGSPYHNSNRKYVVTQIRKNKQ